jgi:hypothetical protein
MSEVSMCHFDTTDWLTSGQAARLDPLTSHISWDFRPPRIDTGRAPDLLVMTAMKAFATGTLLWSLLVTLYAFSPFAGIAALSAGFGFVARGVYPVRVRRR